MRTSEKFDEMGFIVLSAKKVQDRHGDIFYPRKAKTPLRAIRYQCFECMGWDRRKNSPQKPVDAVTNCTDPLCPVFDFRFGKNPFLKGRPGGNPEALKQWKDSSKIS